MYKRPLVPGGFVAPTRLDGEGFHLRPLRAADVVKDFAAVVETEKRLIGFMDPKDTWPAGLTVEENLVDLGWHEREFTLGHSFAYTVMNDGEGRVLGCCYIYPSDRPEYDAMVFYWVREAEYRSSLDRRLGDALRAWIERSWPLRRVAYPGRDIPWQQWTTN
jgi:hypothetical protein